MSHNRKARYLLASLFLALLVVLAVWKLSTPEPVIRYSITDSGELGNYGNVDIDGAGNVLMWWIGAGETETRLWKNGVVTRVDFPVFERFAVSPIGIDDDGSFLVRTPGLLPLVWRENEGYSDRGYADIKEKIVSTQDIPPEKLLIREVCRSGGAFGVITNENPQSYVPFRMGDAFYWSESTGFVDFKRVVGGAWSEIVSINDAGVATGTRYFGPTTASFVWSASEGTTFFEGLSDDPCLAKDINDRNQVVGFCFITGTFQKARNRVAALLARVFKRWLIPTYEPKHAFLWNSGQTTDLNLLIPPDSGWELTEAHGINNRGQIVGIGLLDGKEQAFLLTPIEEKDEDF